MTMIQAGLRAMCGLRAMLSLWAICATTLASALLLSGCDAGESTPMMGYTNSMTAGSQTQARAVSTPATRASSTEATDHRPIVACFGDSLTAGYGVDADESYPNNLQRDLDRAGYRYRVLNLGISGETTKDGLARIDRVIALRPAIAVVEFGGNDGLRGIPVTSSRENLDAMISRLQSAGVKVALAGITLPPQFGGAYVQQFNQTYTLMAQKHKVPLYPFLLLNVYGVAGSIQPDGIHPTAQGCKQVAKNVMGFIRPLLSK